MTALAVPFAQALASYPACVQERAKHLGLTTTTQLWILGDSIEWSGYKLDRNDPARLPLQDAIALSQANWGLSGNDDLPGLLGELSSRLGFPVSAGDLLTWDKSQQWTHCYQDMAPQGRLVARGPEYPFMATPLAIEVGRFKVFPAWTLTRQTGVRRVA